MVYVLLLLVAIVFFVISVMAGKAAKKRRLRRRKRRLVAVFYGIRIALTTSAIVLVTATVFLLFKKVAKGISKDHYTVKNVEVWQNELYSERVDPTTFRIESGQDSSISTIMSGEDSGNGNEEITSKGETPYTGAETYDYSLLMIFGRYQFGESITIYDLEKMKGLYNEYWREEKYEDMLGWNDGESEVELDKRIGEFDDEVKKEEIKSAEEYFQNAEDRLNRYGGKNEDIRFLEQSAISCENALECIKPVDTEEYNQFFTYVQAAVIRFSCVLDKGDMPYDSGTDNDIKYRMGKALYKPAVNLKLDKAERYYSLCSAYVVLKDAFDYGSLDSKYAVEMAYYYMLVCNDIVNAMEVDQSWRMRDRVKLAYYQLRERVDEKNANAVYNNYCKEGEKIMEMLDRQY